MKNKEFDIVDVILERFDYAPSSKECIFASNEESKAHDLLYNSLNPKQKKLFLDYQDKKDKYFVMHEKDVATYVIKCLRSILK